MLHGISAEAFWMLAALPEWLSSTWSVVLLVLGFSLVIFVHELGHFIAAKWAGVRVDRFSIGFGKELFGFTKGQTRYSFCVLPLGGYVKMLGQEDFVVDKSGELKVKGDPDSFTNKPIGKRMVIISGGVLMNLLFAAVAFAIVVMVGRWQPPPVVGMVAPNSPAARAGLQTGDRIVKVNGDDVDSFGDLTSTIVLSDPEEELVLDVMRDGRLVEPKPVVLPEFKEDVSLRQVGVASGQNLRVREPSLGPEDEARLPNELQKNDELFKVAADGEFKESRDIGVFTRAITAGRGAPVSLIVKRPKDPESLTDEMLLTTGAEVDSNDVHVQCQAIWTPAPFDYNETISGSLLGLVPRLTVLAPLPKKSFERAGVLPGDVIRKIGSIFYPSYDQLKELIESSDGQELSIEVCRTRAANHGLEPLTVEFCVRHREAFIAAAADGDLAKALEQVAKDALADGMPETEHQKLHAALAALTDAAAWRAWFEEADVHKLGPLVPKSPFALFSKRPPTIDAVAASIDDDHLVVADVHEKLGDRESPAKLAGIPRGVVILSANGQLVCQWWQLCEVLRRNAGQTIDVTYRAVDETITTKFAVPGCLSASLDIPLGARVVKIDGRTKCAFRGADGKEGALSLPDWRAIAGILKDSVGKTVAVEYVTAEGARRTGEYAVTADNTDPWLHRILFSEGFGCYPLFERHPVHNPILAIGVGFKEAYQATMQTIQTLRHLIFTRQVGFSKISGPVGIIRLGSQAADSGVITLLWFLAILSANLAVINFLPMPIVDGGLFLFLILEKIRGEPVSIKTQVATQLIGIALIATIFLLVTYQDIRNWIIGA